jgi:hypothetical protein
MGLLAAGDEAYGVYCRVVNGKPTATHPEQGAQDPWRSWAIID